MIFNSILKNYDQEPLTVVLKDIIDRYDIYFIDLWGVMHNGKDPFPKAIEAVNQLLDYGKKVIFLSNMPRPKEIVFKTMNEYGLKSGYDVITSGDCTRNYLMDHHKNDKIYHFGKEVNTDILDGLDVKTTDVLEEADIFVVSIFVDNCEDLTPYIDICKKIAVLNKPVICSNPDQLATFGNTTRITAGYFCKMIEKNGCYVEFIGKPFLSIYTYAFLKFNIDPTKDHCLMIGDTVETDILGGFNASMDTLLVLSGITNMLLAHNKESIIEHCEKNLYPLSTYIMKELAYK